LICDTEDWPKQTIMARKSGLETRDSILAPGHFVVFVFRKPTEKTVAEQVLSTGTGALNIDASRVFTDWTERPDSWKRSGHSAKPDAEKIAAPPGVGINCHPSGRWPANLVFVHRPGCKMFGTKQVRGSNAPGLGCVEEERPGGVYSKGSGEFKGNGNRIRHSSPEGTETVTDWVCVLGCLVPALDTQSGDRPPGWFASTRTRGLGYQGSKNETDGGKSSCLGDTGGASRFFKQTPDLDALLSYLRNLISPPDGIIAEP
jgi:hypothetical protein